METISVVTLSKGNSMAVIDVQNGGKLKLLVLTDPKTKKPHTVVNDKTTESNYRRGGSFFLYPWVGRLRSEELDLPGKKIKLDPPIKDANGYSIHGYYTKSTRKIVQKAENILELTAEPSYKPNDEHFPNFCEKFILEEDRLRIENVFEGDSTKKYPLYFAYGYHPYFSFEGKKVDDLVLKTNVHQLVELDPKTNLPVLTDGKLTYDKVETIIKDGEPIKAELNHLFFFDESKAGDQEPLFQLIDPVEKVGVEIVSNIANERKNVNLCYWQIFTLPDRTSIAIEPMTSPADSFNIEFPKHVVTLKDENDFKDANWEIRIINV